jgi:predicted dehydrogenase
MEKPRIGLIGAGFIGVAHANALETILSEGLVSAEFIAVCDVDEQRAKTIAESFGAKKHIAKSHDLINSGEINTVFVCTPTKSHPSIVEAAAQRKLNIFCEKPLARSLDEAREMQSVIVEAEVKNQVGLVLRYSPVYNVIRELISDSNLGRPMSVIFRDDQYFPITGIYGSTWRSDAEVAGGGALIEHSIHDVDIMRWLFGDVTRVRAKTRNFAGHQNIEDLAVAELEFQSGCIAQLLSVWHNVLGRESNRYLEIFFENGYVSSADDFIGAIHYQTGRRNLETLSAEDVLDRYLSAVGLNDPKYNSIHSGQGLENYHFLRALDMGTPTNPDFNVAVKAHEIVEAIYTAARENTEITLPL